MWSRFIYSTFFVFLVNFVFSTNAQCPGGRIEFRKTGKFCCYDKEIAECYKIISSPIQEFDAPSMPLEPDNININNNNVGQLLGRCADQVYQKGCRTYCCRRGFTSGRIKCTPMRGGNLVLP